MTPEQWQRIDELFYLVVELGEAERSAYLDSVCASEPDIRQAVQKLIAADRAADKFLSLPAQVAYDWANDEAPTLRADTYVGTLIGHFQIIKLLGAGGMGNVYLAEDIRLGRKVALKRLKVESTNDPELVRRFKQEARAASALNHPNIVTIFEIDEFEGESFIATEFIEGETLRQHVNRSSLPLSQVLEIVWQIASALREAHAAGIVHRDIKPENVMVRPDGLVKVLDFGLAKLKRSAADNQAERALNGPSISTQPGIVMGTVAYMSPEQVRGKDVDGRSDLFSLGVLFYELIAGRRPFSGETTSDVMAEILKSEPTPVFENQMFGFTTVESILGTLLQKIPANRFQSAELLLNDLNVLKRELETQPTTANAKPIKSSQLLNKGRRKPILGAVLLIVAIVSAFIYFSYIRKQPITMLNNKDWVLLADFNNSTGDAVFDGTLKQGLSVALAQSPFINIFPEAKARQTLRLMGQSADARLTVELSREICQRQGVKALLTGSIAPLGSKYVVTLEAINARSGEVVARELLEVESKESLLSALGRAAAGLREKLGESLPSIQKFDAPLELTTSSLEALRAFSLGREQSFRGRYLRAISFHRHAVELDPKFAFAYAVMAAMYSYTGQTGQAELAAKKGEELKAHASELEKYLIQYFYYQQVTGELNKVQETLDLWQQTYPRDWRVIADQAETRLLLGQFEKAVADATETVTLDPNPPLGHELLGKALIRQNRFDDARQAYSQAIQQKVDTPEIRDGLLQLALINWDDAGAQAHIQSFGGQLEEYLAVYRQAEASALAGQFRRAQPMFRRAIELTVQIDARELAARFSGEQALNAALVGASAQAKTLAVESLAFSRDRVSLRQAALAFAFSGDFGKAQSLAEELSANYPKATLVQTVWLPVIRGAIEFNRGHFADAVAVLEPAQRSQPIAEFWINYLLGQSYLRQQNTTQARAEFQAILDHRGWAPMSTLYPLAQLSLAQSLAMNGQTSEAQHAYRQFLELWKNADADLPIQSAIKRMFM